MDLQERVERFNAGLEMWHRQYGCTAEFAWKHDHEGRKYLTVQQINLDVYRADAVEASTLREAIRRLEEEGTEVEADAP